MAKVIITTELTGLIKTLRLENGISSKALAEHLGKSVSYVTKLESGAIQSMQEDTLLSLLNFVLGEKENTEEIIESVFRTLNYRYSAKEVEEQLWFYNFDTVIRNIPVPETFRSEILELLDSNSISIHTLVDLINSNEFIPDKALCNLKNIPLNQWFECKVDGKSETYIMLKVTEAQIDSILNGDSAISNYVTLLAIILYLKRVTIYPELDVLDTSTYRDLNSQAKAFLERHKILTLSEKQKRINNALSQTERELQLSESDNENLHLLDELRDNLELYSDFTIITANKNISSFNKNLEWDAPFIMRLAAIEFRKLDPCSVSIKRAIISDIEQVLEKYLKIPVEKRNFEEY